MTTLTLNIVGLILMAVAIFCAFCVGAGIDEIEKNQKQKNLMGLLAVTTGIFWIMAWAVMAVA
ncbi:hypothetical protein [Roseovarius sp. MMSF_3281]|uniref:hypothetical protein n=1 Tax=Roseovarius sp. MMSF_3281 TaxID=3046694 RepID=UPI00273FDE0C|nr:hypothetical protein [Roseovarius sp. MMSF_3281]